MAKKQTVIHVTLLVRGDPQEATQAVTDRLQRWFNEVYSSEAVKLEEYPQRSLMRYCIMPTKETQDPREPT